MHSNIAPLRCMMILWILWLAATMATAQVRPGIKFGASTPDVHPEDFLVTNRSGESLYRVLVEKARYGVHAGVFLQIQMGGFFIQPEILYNSTSIDYRIDTLFAPGAGSNLFKDGYRQIDFPFILGLKSGPVRLGGGPVGHLHLDSDTGFSDYESFDAVVDDWTWGWQAGAGLDVWKLHVDIRYEGNFSKLGDHINFFGQSYDFATSNNRFMASLGFSF